MGERLTSVRNIPEDVKAALISEATDNSVGLATWATKLLAEYLGLPFEVSERRPPRAAGITDQLQLRLSDEIATALWATARAWNLTQSQAAIRIWAEHFGIAYRPVRRKS